MEIGNLSSSGNLLIICPSRKRPDRIKEMLKSFDETKSEGTELVIYVSECDPRLEEYKVSLEGRNYIIDKKIPVSHVYNYCVKRFPDYKYYGEVCDDHIYRTKGWDKILTDEIEKNGGWGIAWGQGLIHPQDVRLPQAAIISGNIVRAQGFFSSPYFTCAWNDQAVKTIGEALNCLYYRPDVVVEHVHCLNGKAPMDDNYRWTLSQEVQEIGRNQFEYWKKYELQNDVKRILDAKSRG